MDNKTGKWAIIVVVLLSVLITACIMNANHYDNTTGQINNTINIDNGDTKINWGRYSSTDIELSNSLEITQSGTYHLTGTLRNGNIVVKAPNDGVVRIILDNVTIQSANGPAIVCYSGDDLVIESIGSNTLSDGQSYDTSYDEDVTGAIYSKADLTFSGDGASFLTANYQDGVVGKDDVKFTSGTYNIVAADDGIRGKDSVYIIDGNYTIDSVADAIKTTNEVDQGKGFIMIEGGNFNLTSGSKGVKAINSILIKNGHFAINSVDDSIHSNNYVGISGGTFSIDSGDDGIHADRELIIDGGDITIAKAYEGLEAQKITMNNGTVNLTTTDDGINAGGGADSSSTNRPGANAFDADENCIITINGGTLSVNAAGDGIDSNGWVYFNGGKITVDGPTNNGNGALDAGMGIVMNGGEVVAIGASGMAESLGTSSSVCNVSIYLSSAASAKTILTIQNSKGETVMEHTSAKSFNHIAFGSNVLELGETYSLYLNGEKQESFTISGTTTIVGGNNSNNQMMPGFRR